MPSHVTDIFRYPVKGLTGEKLPNIQLEHGEGILGDRAIAITRQAGLFDPLSPVAISKMNFLMLAKDEDLAKLETHFDAQTKTLNIRSKDTNLLSASVVTDEGKAKISEFFKSFLDKPDLAPEVMIAPGHKFTDISVVSSEKMLAVSLINLASVRALEKAIGQSIDPRRFRANIYFDSDSPFEEDDWMEQDIQIGGAVLRCVMKTKRCPATEVNPESGQRDIRIPFELRKHFGRVDMGIYAEVKSSGSVKLEDRVAVK